MGKGSSSFMDHFYGMGEGDKGSSFPSFPVPISIIFE